MVLLTPRRALLAASLAAPAIARAQARPIRLVIPFPPGGTTDVVGRLIAQGLSEAGTPVTPENRPGAGGAIGAAEVARSTPDGTTLLMTNASFPLNSLVLETAGRATYRLAQDFAPVSQVINVTVVLATHPSAPGNDLRAYLTALREQRLSHFYGSTGPGSFLHLVFEILQREAGVRLEQVVYRGAAPLMQDLIQNRIQIGGDQLPTSIQLLRAGSVKGVATTASRRNPLAPDLPTVAELGLGAAEIDSWNGIFAPSATPPDILARLNAQIGAFLAREEVRRRLSDMTAEPVGGPAETMGQTFTAQIARFRPVIEALRITPEG
jgi:tripartite-type tricarboxylate transporter receptor subunit TctC